MFNYSIIKIYFDKDKNIPTGVLIQIDNGDTQYLTMKDYNVFKNKKY